MRSRLIPVLPLLINLIRRKETLSPSRSILVGWKGTNHEHDPKFKILDSRV